MIKFYRRLVYIFNLLRMSRFSKIYCTFICNFLYFLNILATGFFFFSSIRFFRCVIRGTRIMEDLYTIYKMYIYTQQEVRCSVRPDVLQGTGWYITAWKYSIIIIIIHGDIFIRKEIYSERKRNIRISEGNEKKEMDVLWPVKDVERDVGV